MVFCTLHQVWNLSRTVLFGLCSAPKTRAMVGLSIPYVAFIAGVTVFFEKVTVFVLKQAGLVVFFLVVDLKAQVLLLAYSDGEGSITELPRKTVELRALGFQPFA